MEFHDHHPRLSQTKIMVSITGLSYGQHVRAFFPALEPCEECRSPSIKLSSLPRHSSLISIITTTQHLNPASNTHFQQQPTLPNNQTNQSTKMPITVKACTMWQVETFLPCISSPLTKKKLTFHLLHSLTDVRDKLKSLNIPFTEKGNRQIEVNISNPSGWENTSLKKACWDKLEFTYHAAKRNGDTISCSRAGK